MGDKKNTKNIKVIKIQHSTYQQHIETWQRAKSNSVTYIWSGDLRRNPYLRESFEFGLLHKIIEAEEVVDYAGQESGYLIKYLK